MRIRWKQAGRQSWKSSTRISCREPAPHKHNVKIRPSQIWWLNLTKRQLESSTGIGSGRTRSWRCRLASRGSRDSTTMLSTSRIRSRDSKVRCQADKLKNFRIELLAPTHLSRAYLKTGSSRPRCSRWGSNTLWTSSGICKRWWGSRMRKWTVRLLATWAEHRICLRRLFHSRKSRLAPHHDSVQGWTRQWPTAQLSKYHSSNSWQPESSITSP